MRRRGGRKAFVLVTVLIVVGAALFIATSFLFTAQAELSGAAATIDAVQSRALLHSALRAMMVELDGQRATILDGEDVRLEFQYVLYETSTELGVARLLPAGPGGVLFASENARLDINRVDAEQIVATGFVDETTATAIIALRDERGGTFNTLAELLAVDGVSAETLYGPLEDVHPTDDAAFVEGDITERVGDRLAGETARGLADVFTVWSFEPALQRSGRLRINLNTPWSEELGDRIEERYDAGVRNGLQQIMQNGQSFESDADIYNVLAFFSVEPEEWPDVVDTVTTDAEPYHVGRLNINAASYEALVAMGMTPDEASAVIDTRDGVSREDRATIAWPAITGVIEPARYAELGDWMTVRTWLYRVRIATGTVSPDDEAGPLRSPLIVEAVIDLSAPAPRLAYLRDITMLQTTAALAARGVGPADDFDRDPLDDGGLDDPADEMDDPLAPPADAFDLPDIMEDLDPSAFDLPDMADDLPDDLVDMDEDPAGESSAEGDPSDMNEADGSSAGGNGGGGDGNAVRGRRGRWGGG